MWSVPLGCCLGFFSPNYKRKFIYKVTEVVGELWEKWAKRTSYRGKKKKRRGPWSLGEYAWKIGAGMLWEGREREREESWAVV